AAGAHDQAVPEVGSCRQGAGCSGAKPDCAEYRGGSRVHHGAWSRVFRAALRPRVVAAARRGAAYVRRSTVPRVVYDARAARDRSSEQDLHLATEAELSDPDRRARPDSLWVWTDLGLGQDDPQRCDGSPAARESQAVLSLGQELPARVRAVRPGLSLAVHGGSGFRATCARAAGIRALAHRVPAAGAAGWIDNLVSRREYHRSQRPEARAPGRFESQPRMDARGHCRWTAHRRQAPKCTTRDCEAAYGCI